MNSTDAQQPSLARVIREHGGDFQVAAQRLPERARLIVVPPLRGDWDPDEGLDALRDAVSESPDPYRFTHVLSTMFGTLMEALLMEKPRPTPEALKVLRLLSTQSPDGPVVLSLVEGQPAHLPYALTLTMASALAGLLYSAPKVWS